jgi:hypothetical protein
MGTLLMTREHVADTPEDLEKFRRKHPLTEDGVVECAYPVSRYREALIAAGLSKIKEWGPFDSVINYYPATAQDIRDKAQNMMFARWWHIGLLLFRHFIAVREWAIHELSQRHISPGRLYSFCGTKVGRE